MDRIEMDTLIEESLVLTELKRKYKFIEKDNKSDSEMLMLRSDFQQENVNNFINYFGELTRSRYICYFQKTNPKT